MVTTSYGVRNYTTSEKTKRAKKIKLDENLTEEERENQLKEILDKKNKEIEKRNNTQKRLYITLENIDEIFSNNDNFPVNYDFIFNLIQGKVTKFFKTRNYDRKKEVSYDAMNRLYSALKRKLLILKDNQGLLNPKPVLFFYLSQFFSYVEFVVYSTVYYGTMDQKYMVQELEDLPLIEELVANGDDLDAFTILEKERLGDKRSRIKSCIEKNPNLSLKEKNLLFKIYRSSSFMGGNLTNKDEEDLKLLQERLQLQPGLLQELEDICNEQ